LRHRSKQRQFTPFDTGRADAQTDIVELLSELASVARVNSARSAEARFFGSAVNFSCISAFARRRRAGMIRKPSMATRLAMMMPVWRS